MSNSLESTKYSSNEAVKKLHNKLFLQTAFLAFLRFFTAFSFFAGIIIIILRQLHYFSNSAIVLWIASGFVLSLIYGIYYASKHDVSEATCIAAIDAENSAGGLLMAENELSDHSWKFAKKSLYSIPEINTRCSRELLLCLVAIIFAVSCCLVPLINLRKTDRKINLTNKIAEIHEKVELLEEKEIITPEEKKLIEEELDKIVENSDKSAPGITFEALDQLNEKLCHEAASEVKKRISDNELLKKLEKFAREAKSSEAARQGKANELLDQLKNILRQSGMNENQINDFLNKHFGGSSADSGISQKQIEKYADQLGEQSREKLQEAAKIATQMAEQKLIPPELAEQLSQEAANSQNSENQQNGNQSGNLQNETKGQGEGNLVAVPQNPDGKGEGNNEGNGQGQNGDQGGSSSGSGQPMPVAGNGGIGKDVPMRTPLSFGDKTSDYNAKYHDEVLPETNTESVTDAVSVGIGISAPQTSSEVSKSKATEINMNATGNKSGNKTVLPKYRNTVKNYFSK